MSNTIIDVASDSDPKDIIAEAGGAVTRDVRVTIREGVSKSQAHVALQAISNVLISDSIKLEQE
jgi:hypothetical protein